jgi:hypothetical protein
MNVHSIGKDLTGKILAMDYISVLARVTDDWDDRRMFDVNEDYVLDFARHNRRLNVLFSGGEVRSMTPEEVDPSVISNQVQYWLP